MNVLKYMPIPGADGRILIPRRIGQQDNQVVLKVDHRLSQKDQLSVRYFFDNFHNDPTYTEGNLLSYSNPTLAAGTRMQNIVGGWTRTFSTTLLNEARIGYNHTFSRRFPPHGVPSMQDLGVRLPIYPTLPSISEINANNFFNIGDNLEASFYRPGIELSDRMTWNKGKHNLQFGGELQRYTVEIRNQFRRAGHFQFAGSTTTGTGNTLADFLLGQLSQFDQGTGEYKDYRGQLRVAVRPGRLQGEQPADVEPGRPARVDAALAREGRPHRSVHAERLPEQRALDDVPAGAARRNVPRRPGRPRGRHRSVGLSTSGPRVGFAWDITGDGKTSLRGGGGAFYDQHRDGESGNGAVNAAPWNLRLSVVRPTGPFSDPYRGRNDFDLITDETIGTQQALFPKPVLIETLDQEYKTPVTYNFNLTFEREVTQGIMARAAYVGSRNRNGRFTVSLNPADRHHSRRDDRQHRRAASVCGRRHRQS